jgi:aminobenzoyl-glutamate utilization protein B
MTSTHRSAATAVLALLFVAGPAAGRAHAQGRQPATAAKPSTNPKVEALKREATADVDSMKDFTQQMIDQVFSFGELAFQETETSKYLTDILEKNGFRIERGYAGIPTAWVATWGSGRPVIALGSDIDCIPRASQ